MIDHLRRAASLADHDDCCCHIMSDPRQLCSIIALHVHLCHGLEAANSNAKKSQLDEHSVEHEASGCAGIRTYGPPSAYH
jgi:hypothetical protein